MTTSLRWIDQRSKLLSLSALKALVALGLFCVGSCALLAQTALPPPSTLGNSTAVCGPTTIVTTAGSTVTVTGTGVSFVASSQITFNPGFSSQAGATFTASIGSCSSTTQYYLTTSANTSSEGSISPGSQWVNSGTPVQVSASPSSGYQFTGFSGSLTGATTPQNLTITGTMSVTANFAPVGSALQTFITCVGPNPPQPPPPTCPLPIGTYTISQATGTIAIGRSNVTVTGGSSNRSQTMLVRDPAFTAEMMTVNGSSPLTGVTIENLTFCGSSTLNGGAGTSPVGCPRVQTTCGTQTAGAGPLCVDLWVHNATTNLNPSNPFSNTGPYSVTISNVDLEDATGHALALYPTAPNRADDIYITGSAINYSAVTGILLGANLPPGVNYDRKFCDGDVVNGVNVFNNDTTVYTPRDIRIENIMFNNNNTVVIGNEARWVGLRYSTFNNNYINPQADYGPGGGVFFDTCADTVQIYNNTMTGPSPSQYDDTSGLELHGRNIDIQGNNISGYPNEAISINSTYNTNVANNNNPGLTNNDQNVNYAPANFFKAGGIVLRTSPPTLFPANFCGQIERDTNLIKISSNTVTGQAYGVEFADFGLSRNTFGIQSVMDDVMIAQNNVLSGNPVIALDDQMITLINYSGPNAILANSGAGFAGTPRALAVDAVSPVTSRCSTAGVDRETFTFEASDSGGASNIALIQVIVSQNGNDSDGMGPAESQPTIANGPPGCHFIYYPSVNVVYLDGPNVDFSFSPSPNSSIVGAGGQDLVNSYCTIHAGSSASQPQTEPLIQDVTLDIEFAAGTQNNKHIYVNAANSSYNPNISPSVGLSTGPILGFWNYWGWWYAP